MYQYEEDFFLLFLLHMTKASTKVDKYTKGFYQVDNIFTHYIEEQKYIYLNSAALVREHIY